ncbi:calpain-A-like [Neocloeon triangulifer]|uniref:calpain-A-like n=1 Tax=Neocloeon triangulifer TaxID=2078957 RepID=UPI00286F1C67|nr:calpain-A-like [Neocloeon triangulifer]
MALERVVEKKGLGELGSWSIWSDQALSAFRNWGFKDKDVDDAAVKQSRSKFWRKGAAQDFNSIRDQCQREGILYEDPDFPCTTESLFYSKAPPIPFKWLRPSQIVKDPRLFVEGYSRFDIKQGELTDCWLLAALANLTLHNSLFSQVVPEDQCFEKGYAGVFHFKFWQYGKWVEVIIDDRLPTFDGKLVFLRSSQQNEFWSALLEKAYAKLHGSYEALKGGSTCEAMEDFTGGVTEWHELDNVDMNFFKMLQSSFDRQSLLGASIEPGDEFEEPTPEGLVKGHAYSITKVQYVDIKTPRVSGKIPLIRLRNPWGNAVEWNGAWSDKSPEWQFIPPEEQKRIGLTFDADGEFWMSFRDFVKYFTRLEICNLSPHSIQNTEGKKKWEMSVFEGEWVRGVTAGGCRNYPKTFCFNPQYRVTLDQSSESAECTVIVALMQKNRRVQRKMGAQCLNIGFVLYQLDEASSLIKPLPDKFFLDNVSTRRCRAFVNQREVTERFSLVPGTYCIVPSTFDPHEEGEFLLRIFSESTNKLEENDRCIGFLEMTTNKISTSPMNSVLDDKVKAFFKEVAGEDMEVDWMELKNVLDLAINKDLQRCSIGPASLIQRGGFSKEICRSMVAMMDSDRSGKLGYEEFKTLWLDIGNWRRVFKDYDKNNSGMLSNFELREALASAGYQLNYRILNVLMHRYGTKEGQITFDDFIACAVRLRCMIDMFKERDPRGTNKAVFTFDEWMEKVIFS